LLREVVMPVAPQGMNQVHLSDGRVSSANDTAISVALFAYALKHNRNYKDLSVLGFEGGSHGYSISTLSCADTATNKNNCPTFNWPTAPLPKLKYPLA
jgi:adenosylmethionine-8-amino-7-oxononanoate aminotransferase